MTRIHHASHCLLVACNITEKALNGKNTSRCKCKHCSLYATNKTCKLHWKNTTDTLYNLFELIAATHLLFGHQLQQPIIQQMADDNDCGPQFLVTVCIVYNSLSHIRVQHPSPWASCLINVWAFCVQDVVFIPRQRHIYNWNRAMWVALF